MSKVLDEVGRLVDAEVNKLGQEVATKFRELLAAHPEWALEDATVVAYHLQSYVGAEVMRHVMLNVVKKQGGLGAPPSLRPVPAAPDA